MKTKAILLGLTFALIPGLNRAENGIKMVVGTYTDLSALFLLLNYRVGVPLNLFSIPILRV